ncbi:MAG: hypothetical protein HY671_11925, partial [Chloroflexi bacterium]|nr:hypothetical protein [Chloroflexota bacterium]
MAGHRGYGTQIRKTNVWRVFPPQNAGHRRFRCASC